MIPLHRQPLHRRARTAAAVLVCVIVCCTLGHREAAAQPFQYQWNIKALARADGDVIELRTRNGKLIKKLSASQIRIIYAVKTSIEAVAELQTEMIIVDGQEPNAFAGQGTNRENIIGINFAMLDLLGMDVHAVAALIGHEIAHLKLEHGKQQQTRAAGTALMSAIGGLALGTLGVPGGQTLSNLTFAAIATGYTRDDEREADYLGAIWAVEADYEPEGAVRLQEAVYNHSRSAPSPFLSTHPSGPERIATLKSLSRRLSTQDYAD